MLFIIYINDITDVHLSDGSMTIYADDIMIYWPICVSPDYEFVQQDIDKLCTWTSNNLLKFNSIKCKYMVISRKRLPSQPNTPLTVNHLPMEKVQSYIYLGVWLMSSLSRFMQDKRVCQKARWQIGIIYRKFYGHSNCSTLLQLYLAYIRPHLEYAVPVWDPYQQELINLLNQYKSRFPLGTGLWIMAVSWTSVICPHWPVEGADLKLCFYIRSFMVTECATWETLHTFEPEK